RTAARPGPQSTCGRPGTGRNYRGETRGETMKLSNHRNLLAAALLLVPAALPKTHAPAPKATPAPSGKLDIRLMITDQPDPLLHPTKGPDGKYTQAQPATVAARGSLLVGFVFFKDCKPDAKDFCNVDLDVLGLTPSGAPFENKKGTDLWHNSKAPHAG